MPVLAPPPVTPAPLSQAVRSALTSRRPAPAEPALPPLSSQSTLTRMEYSLSWSDSDSTVTRRCSARRRSRIRKSQACAAVRIGRRRGV